MVYSLHLSSLTLRCSLALLFFFAFPPNNLVYPLDVPLDVSLVDSICRQNIVLPFYDFCVQIIMSDPRGLTSDIVGIGRIALEQAIVSAIDTMVLVDDMARAPNSDSTIQLYLLKCSDQYSDAVDNIQQAFSYLEARLKNDLSNKVVTSTAETNACEAGFNGPPARPSPISDRNNKLSNLTTIVYAIASLL